MHLICGVNWLGDTLMSMPAIEAWRMRHPTEPLALLVKPSMIPLWSMHEAPNALLALPPGLRGTRTAIAAVRRHACQTAYVFPHSFRSAFIPFAARIPRRIGMPGHFRDWMLTEKRPVDGLESEHQAREYFRLLGLDQPDDVPPPVLRLPAEDLAWAGNQSAAWPRPWFSLLPGAARGPSKQWPEQHFAALGKALARQMPQGTILLPGPSGDHPLCARIAQAIGPRAVNLAGETSFGKWLALLRNSAVVIANDSGGMHAAAALGTPVIALFGLTDPRKTGPLGSSCAILQKSAKRARDIPRHSPEAEAALAAITPGEVLEHIRQIVD